MYWHLFIMLGSVCSKFSVKLIIFKKGLFREFSTSIPLSVVPFYRHNLSSWFRRLNRNLKLICPWKLIAIIKLFCKCQIIPFIIIPLPYMYMTVIVYTALIDGPQSMYVEQKIYTRCCSSKQWWYIFPGYASPGAKILHIRLCKSSHIQQQKAKGSCATHLEPYPQSHRWVYASNHLYQHLYKDSNWTMSIWYQFTRHMTIFTFPILRLRLMVNPLHSEDKFWDTPSC